MLMRCIAAENRKLRGSAIWAAFLAVPLISALYGTFNYLQNIGILQAEWYSLWTQHTLFYAMFFFAPLVGVYAAYLWRLEHLGHNWNLIMSAPVKPVMLYMAKLVVVAKMALLTQLWVFALYLLCGKLWARLPGWPPAEVAFWLLRGAAGALPIAALELLLAMVIRTFAIPVLIALGGSVAGMLFASRGAGLIWPYSLMIMGMNSNKSEDVIAGGVPAFIASCIIFLLLFIAAANLILTRRDVKA